MDNEARGRAQVLGKRLGQDLPDAKGGAEGGEPGGEDVGATQLLGDDAEAGLIPVSLIVVGV